MKQSKYLLLTLLLMVLGSSCDNHRKVPQQENTADTVVAVKKDLLSQYDKQIRAYYLDLTKSVGWRNPFFSAEGSSGIH